MVKAIVVTYNGYKWIDSCIGSLLNSSCPVNVIVVDNGSSDGTIEKINKDYPSVKLIKSSYNRGFSGGNNLGIKGAKEENTDYLFLLNQDAWVEKRTIENLVNLSKKKPEYGVLAPMRKINDKQLEKDLVKNIINQGSVKLFSDLYFNNSLEDIYDVNFIGAAAWLLTKKCIQEVGGFDPLFFHYGEDSDFCKRVRLLGLKVGICPNSIVTHDTGERIPDKKMIKRRKFASIIFSLRYKNPSLLKHLSYSLELIYLLIFYKKTIINKEKIPFQFKLKKLRIEI